MKKIIIEVGTHDCKDTLILNNIFPETDAIYGFEAHPYWYQVSKENCKEISKIEIVNQAVFLENKPSIKFNECKSGGASSLLDFKDEAELNRVWGACRQDIHYSGTSYVVSSIRIDTFLESRGYTPENTEILYTHIDAQGVDLEVLMSFGDFLKCLHKGVIETVNSEEKAIYVNQHKNQLVNVLTYLNDNGFKCDAVNPNDCTNCEVNVSFSKKN